MNSTTSQISCGISTTDPSACLGLEIRLDRQVIFDLEHVTNPIQFSYSLGDDEGEHCLEFVMKNKTTNDTTIDSAGNILKDARLIISDITFDEIELNQIFINHAVYTHDFNGSQPETQHKFYGEMGCNGSVSLEFSTPVYLWLLENM
jgi:hypothetical protein